MRTIPDTLTKTVKPFGDHGGHIVLPFKWIGKEVTIKVSDTKSTERLEILSVTTV